MLNTQGYYVCQDDIVLPTRYDTPEDAEAAARDLRDTQKMTLLASRKILKLFKKGVPLNLSNFYIICVARCLFT